MGLERYKITPTPFERYYEAFLQNSLRGRRYKIVLAGGESAVGVPTSGSLANPADPNVSFLFHSQQGEVYQIPYRELEHAEPAE